MKKHILINAVAVGLTAGSALASTISLSFDNLSTNEGGSVAAFTSSTTGALAGIGSANWGAGGGILTATGDDLDLFGNGNLYDIEMTVSFTGNGLSGSASIVLNPGDDMTFGSLATTALTVYESDGVTVASDVTVDAFNGYTAASLASFNFPNPNTGTIAGGAIVPNPVDANAFEQNFASTSSFTVENTTGGSGNGRNFTVTGVTGGFTLTAVPEPSSAALIGLGGIALILRRCR